MSASPSRLRTLATAMMAVAGSLLLAACDAVVEVDATANVPARYSSVLVTVKEVWFHHSATADPADPEWEKFSLDDTVTLDLVDLDGGSLARIADDMVVPAGTYRQMRVILASRDENLHDSADDAGAEYNNEISWFDEDGDARTAPLEVLNADQGIGIALDLKVREAAVALGGSADSASNRVHLVFDAARDLTEFRYGDEPGFLLNPTLRAFDAREAGVIRGTLDLSRLVNNTGTGRPDIQVTAQKRDENLGRGVMVGSAAVGRTGSFVLYPLPLDEDENVTEYDLVIHGPRIQTVIIREVPVTEGGPGDAVNAALGTLSLEPADAFEADLAAGSVVFPRGARIGFYQTMPGEEESFLVGTANVDPLSGRLALPVELSRANTVLHGAYGATLRAVTPEEGGARYSVAALSPHYGHGSFAETTLRPAGTASDTASFSVPAIGVPASAGSGAIAATVTIATPAVRDRGVLFVTREGAVVTVASLDEPLQQLLGSTFVDVDQVPAGSASATLDSGLYALEAWAWHSSDPEDSFTRHPATGTVDLRNAPAASGSVLIP